MKCEMKFSLALMVLFCIFETVVGAGRDDDRCRDLSKREYFLDRHPFLRSTKLSKDMLQLLYGSNRSRRRGHHAQCRKRHLTKESEDALNAIFDDSLKGLRRVGTTKQVRSNAPVYYVPAQYQARLVPMRQELLRTPGMFEPSFTTSPSVRQQKDVTYVPTCAQDSDEDDLDANSPSMTITKSVTRTKYKTTVKVASRMGEDDLEARQLLQALSDGEDLDVADVRTTGRTSRALSLDDEIRKSVSNLFAAWTDRTKVVGRQNAPMDSNGTESTISTTQTTESEASKGKAQYLNSDADNKTTTSTTTSYSNSERDNKTTISTTASYLNSDGDNKTTTSSDNVTETTDYTCSEWGISTIHPEKTTNGSHAENTTISTTVKTTEATSSTTNTTASTTNNSALEELNNSLGELMVVPALLLFKNKKPDNNHSCLNRLKPICEYIKGLRIRNIEPFVITEDPLLALLDDSDNTKYTALPEINNKNPLYIKNLNIVLPNMERPLTTTDGSNEFTESNTDESMFTTMDPVIASNQKTQPSLKSVIEKLTDNLAFKPQKYQTTIKYTTQFPPQGKKLGILLTARTNPETLKKPQYPTMLSTHSEPINIKTIRNLMNTLTKNLTGHELDAQAQKQLLSIIVSGQEQNSSTPSYGISVAMGNAPLLNLHVNDSRRTKITLQIDPKNATNLAGRKNAEDKSKAGQKCSTMKKKEVTVAKDAGIWRGNQLLRQSAQQQQQPFILAPNIKFRKPLTHLAKQPYQSVQITTINPTMKFMTSEPRLAKEVATNRYDLNDLNTEDPRELLDKVRRMFNRATSPPTTTFLAITRYAKNCHKFLPIRIYKNNNPELLDVMTTKRICSTASTEGTTKMTRVPPVYPLKKEKDPCTFTDDLCPGCNKSFSSVEIEANNVLVNEAQMFSDAVVRQVMSVEKEFVCNPESYNPPVKCNPCDDDDDDEENTTAHHKCTDDEDDEPKCKIVHPCKVQKQHNDFNNIIDKLSNNKIMIVRPQGLCSTTKTTPSACRSQSPCNVTPKCTKNKGGSDICSSKGGGKCCKTGQMQADKNSKNACCKTADCTNSSGSLDPEKKQNNLMDKICKQMEDCDDNKSPQKGSPNMDDKDDTYSNKNGGEDNKSCASLEDDIAEAVKELKCKQQKQLRDKLYKKKKKKKCKKCKPKPTCCSWE